MESSFMSNMIEAYTPEYLYIPVDESHEMFHYENVVLNRMWFFQMLTCFVTCVATGRLWPVSKSAARQQTPWAIAQVKLYLLTNVTLYVIEMYYKGIFHEEFDKWMHHFVALLIFVQSFREQNLLSAVYCLPFLVHTFYWLLLAQHFPLLIVYNSLFFVAIFSVLNHGSLRNITPTMPFLGFVIIHVNLFSYFYETKLNLRQIDYAKMYMALLKSSLIAAQLYLYVIWRFRRLRAKKAAAAVKSSECCGKMNAKVHHHHQQHHHSG